MRDLTTEEGRNAFGADAANYDAARPNYPEWIFDRLRDRCGLGANTRTFEIGPGTGIATAKLLDAGANPLVAIEPDERLANFLRGKLGDAVQVVNTTFEDAPLSPGNFDLGAAATSFHWMDQRPALAKIARSLGSGGWWAAWWNVFGDPDRADPFHEATRELLHDQPKSPSHYAGLPHPFALDRDARVADIRAVGEFADASVEIGKWSITLSAKQVRGLYATFSQFAVLDPAERERLLDGLQQIAEKEFSGGVVRNMCTVIYTARKT
jgi:SAM-dependent methyltransferase